MNEAGLSISASCGRRSAGIRPACCGTPPYGRGEDIAIYSQLYGIVPMLSYRLQHRTGADG
jgi:hypothetical protein